ncbi:MAG TPA: transposase [Psychromonas sp.]
MTRYSPERKEAVLRKVLPPQSRSVSEVANEEDIPYNTLYTWLKTVQNNGVIMPNSTLLTAEKKLAIIIETGPLTESELATYCRKNGFYPEQIKAWKEEFVQGVQTKKINNKASIKEAQADKKEIKALKKELRRKDKALAETAALLVLRKKLNALYDLEDEES